jgi:outer membrane protein assembly factor BamB
MNRKAELLNGVPAHLQLGLLPPLYWNGLVLVAPNDSRHLFCLEAASGRILWQRRMPERLRHLIGIADQGRQARLIASGNSLWAFDLDDGGLGWRMTQTEPEERGYGQGLLTGDSIFWPTREWLFQLDQNSGAVQRKLALRTPDAAHYGGNLAVANGLLLIVEPDRIRSTASTPG